MAASKKDRERVREAMSKSLTASPKRQEEIAEMLKSRLSVDVRKLEQKVGKATPARPKVYEYTFAK